MTTRKLPAHTNADGFVGAKEEIGQGGGASPNEKLYGKKVAFNSFRSAAILKTRIKTSATESVFRYLHRHANATVVFAAI